MREKKDQELITDLYEILIVDDERGPRELLKSALIDKGYLVTVAKSGEEACQIFDKKQFELVITDLKMPGLNGLNLLQQIKRQSPETLVILITGYASLNSAINAIRQGAYDYLTKPFQLDELYIVVKNAVERIKLMKENNALLEKLQKIYKKRGIKSNEDTVNKSPHLGELDMIQNLRDHLLKVYTRSGKPYPDVN